MNKKELLNFFRNTPYNDIVLTSKLGDEVIETDFDLFLRTSAMSYALLTTDNNCQFALVKYPGDTEIVVSSRKSSRVITYLINEKIWK